MTISTRYSGGAANSNPALSLGGVISSVSVVSETTSVRGSSTAIPGVTILSSFNMPADTSAPSTTLTGQLLYSFSGKILSLKPYGYSSFVADSGDNVVALTADGQYTLTFVSGAFVCSVTVSVVFASLSTNTDYTAYLDTTHAANTIFDDIPVTESRVGAVEYRCLYARNNYATSKTIRLYIANQPRASDEVAIGLDPAGSGGTATVIPNETTAPTGVIFSQPSTFAAGLSRTLTAGQAAAFWIRRTVPVMAVAGSSADEFSIAYEVV